MNRSQAVKVVETALEVPLRTLAFGAGLYEMGVDEPLRQDLPIQLPNTVYFEPEFVNQKMRLF